MLQYRRPGLGAHTPNNFRPPCIPKRTVPQSTQVKEILDGFVSQSVFQEHKPGT